MMRWGTGDGINPMDLINPRDYRNPIAGARADSRVPILLANGIFLLGPIIMEGVLIPKSEVNKPSLADSPWESKVIIRFMSHLIKDSPRKVFLILDNLRVHHSKVVQKWLEEKMKEIRVFYLPAYSPEVKPDEYLNGDLKQQIRSGIPARQ
jgi:hypothetical protein